MLDWKIIYAMSGNELFVANNSELLIEMREAKNSSHGERIDKAFSDWRVMDLKRSEEQFDIRPFAVEKKVSRLFHRETLCFYMT